MTGEDLYLMWWVESMIDEGVGVEEWDQMGEAEQGAWTKLAAQVVLRRG